MILLFVLLHLIDRSLPSSPHHRLFHSSIYAETIGNHMQYLMYTEDNEEAAASARRQLVFFLDPCQEPAGNTSFYGSMNGIKEDLIPCNDDEILSKAGDGYVERHCRSEEELSHNRSLHLRRLSYTEEHCSCMVRCADGMEFFRFAGCRCPHDEFVLPGLFGTYRESLS
ncbi:hypothetical protein ANCCAN_18651 [Ancylostoma caninum]|uniref:Uncharacterized protein n=1 Tax=Ancylostoma caninum TaxID=29170 RepID=A0A368FVI6_ANCCA|nr:hypothetical protein ANCCAN_18651 [Ancylostoma caninum]